MPGHPYAIGIFLPFLLAMPAPVRADGPVAQSPKEQYETLAREYKEADEAWDKKFPGVNSVHPRWSEYYAGWPQFTFAPRFLQFAEANPADPTAVDALLRIVEFADSASGSDEALFSISGRAFAILIRDHLEDQRVVRACFKTRTYGPNVESYCRALIANGRTRNWIAHACLQLVECDSQRLAIAAKPFFDHPEDRPKYRESRANQIRRLDPEYVAYIRATDPVAVSAEREALLERIVDEFGDVPLVFEWVQPGKDNRSIADFARSKLAALRTVAVGMEAPEIEGEDVDGKPLKLSDHRGKVVMLTFWGSWCGPCIRFVPHEVATAERLKDRPFVILGVDNDVDRAQAKAVAAQVGMTWRSWWDTGKNGQPFGPIATRWDVHAWPTIILIDQAGVIRFKNLRFSEPERLDSAIDSLLSEIKP